MFRALLADPQEALHIRHLVYCVLIMSVGCAVRRYAAFTVANPKQQHVSAA
jgi:hypothetical protein